MSNRCRVVISPMALTRGSGVMSRPPDSLCRTASVETPDCAHNSDRSKKNRSLAIRSSLNVNWMNTGSSARLPLGVTPNRPPVIVIRAVPQQTRVSPLLAWPCRATS